MSLALKTLLLKGSPAILGRSLHTSTPAMIEIHNKFMFQLAGYNKYGLLRDDLLSEFNKDIAEAVRRLPEEERLQRIYRAIRAQQAEVNHTILPEDYWTKFEDNHFYLQPYLKEIQNEKEERDEWEANK